jgi:cyclohexyl-isocyanide hydratase
MTISTTRRLALKLAAIAAASTTIGCGSRGKRSASEAAKEEVKFVKHEILMLIYPRFTTLDLIGPQHVFALLGPEFKTRLVWKDKAEVISDTGVPVRATLTFDECPSKPTILFIPGGTDGTLKAMEDDVVRNFVANMGKNATYVTSVCTGSLLLGAAGLLEGYNATTHWLALSSLEQFGATPIAERVVVDRNRITGAGVTAGIDFALTLTSMLKDESYAKSVQLMMEYDPKPPFDSGNASVADPESVKLLEAMAAPFLADVDDAAKRIMHPESNH